MEWQGKQKEEDLVSQKAMTGGRQVFVPYATGAPDGINLMSLYIVIKGSLLNDALSCSVQTEN